MANEEHEPPVKVVIVDDDEFLLKMMAYAFQSQGFDLEVFSNGKDALNYLSNENHLKSTQLLILDRILPDMDGLDILKQLSSKFPNQMPLVLILSVLSAEKDVLQGLELGAVDYLAKPFSVEVLMDKIRALLSKHIR